MMSLLRPATRELWRRFDTGFSGDLVSMLRPSFIAATLITAAAPATALRMERAIDLLVTMPTLTNSLRPIARASLRVPVLLGVAVVCVTCRDTAVVPPPPGDRVVAIAVVPPTASLSSGETEHFVAYSVTAAGDTVPGAAVEWHATGGTITPDGVFTANSDLGTFSVTATSTGVLPGKARVEVFRRVVAQVAVLPDTATVPIQGRWPFSAEVLDSAGNPVSISYLTWTSSDTSVAVVDATGLATGVGPGMATITAAAQGKTGTAVIAVVPPGSGPWTHEPGGFSVISDQPWDALTSLGWALEFDNVHPQIVADARAPQSPPSVLQITYPVGFASGSAPSTMVHSLPGSRQLYVGMWWKASNPWQGNESNSNKIQYIFTNASGSAFMVMYGRPGGPYELRVFPQFKTSSDVWLTPNVTNVPVTLGQWHKIEWLLVYNTTTDPPNGICRWWLDGQLLGDYTNVKYPSEPFFVYKVAPVFGGNGGPKMETDYYWYDHVHLSGR